MDNIKKTIAENLTLLRKKNNLTQTELAKKLNYSDKSVSKWERGDVTPPIDVLKEITVLYGVSLDFLTENHNENLDTLYTSRKNNLNKGIITFLFVTVVWLIATLIYFYNINFETGKKHAWLAFVEAVPASCIILFFFNTIWGKKRRNYYILSLFLWSSITIIYLSLLPQKNFWSIYIIGVPLQIIIVLWSQLINNKNKKVAK